jgi:hypothetical protein
MHLKGQLHIHTTYSDGRLSPQEAADAYSRQGYNFIAFTDHDHLLKPSYRHAVEEVQSNLLIFFGIELTVGTKLGYVHVSRIEGDNEVLYTFNHPGDYGFTLKQTIDCIHDVAEKINIDAVEVTHHGFYTPEYDIDTIRYPKVASDDSHTRLGCGRAWIEVETARDKDSILRAIKSGDCLNCYARGHSNAAMVLA